MGVVGALLVVIIGLFWYLMPQGVHEVAFTEDGRIAYDTESEYWRVRISKMGGEDAYEEFSTAVHKLTPRRQHIAAHVFGEALYREAGIKGTEICDARFMMGCLHAFFGSAALDLGIGSFFTQLVGKCAEGTRGEQLLCLHGVGHGIVGVLGYTQPDLDKALTHCEEVSTADDLLVGCWGGALMEYNVRTLVSLEEPERPFDESVAYTPCEDLMGDRQRACMFWQPTWWHVVFSHEGNDTAAFRRIGSLCERHPDPAMTRACLRGAGFRAAWTSGYDADVTVRLCAAVSRDKATREICWDSARLDLKTADAERAAPALHSDDEGSR